MILLYHRGGSNACGGPALYLIKDQESHYELKADNVVKLDGSKPAFGDWVICGTCGNSLHMQLLSPKQKDEMPLVKAKAQRYEFTLPLVTGVRTRVLRQWP